MQIEKRPFDAYERIAGNGSFSFRVPRMLDFELEEILVRQSQTNRDNGKCTLKFNRVSARYQINEKVPAEFINRVQAGDPVLQLNGETSFKNTYIGNDQKACLKIGGGDLLRVEVSGAVSSDTITDVIFSGKMVGEY